VAQVSCSAALYALISGTWTLLDDVQPWSTSWGTPDNGPLAFMAETGEMKFRLNNATGLYTPGGPSVLSGFKKGIPVKLVVTFESEQYVRFRGFISDIEVKPRISDKTTGITVLDWLDHAARHPIKNPGIMLNKRSDEVMTAITNEIAVLPAQTAFAQGSFAFPTALDTIGKATTAYAEFSKVALTDIVSIYLKKDRTDGETLVLENDNDRHGWVLPGEIPLANADSGLALNENGDFELDENGDFVLLNQTTDYTFDGSALSSFDATFGDGIVNRAVATVYPRRLDTSPQILFQLDTPLEISARPFDGDKRGQNFVIEGTYTDADGGTIISGRDIVPPVATTDCQMFAVVDGVTTATDLTADLYIEFTFGTEGFTAYVANTNTAYPTASITKFNVRGTGIKQYNPVDYTAHNDDSIDEHEAQQVTLHQKYRNSLNVGRVFVKSIVEEYGDARNRLQSVSFCANKSGTLMMAFLHTDIGSLRHIDIDELGVDCNFYIQGIEANYDNGLIWVTWNVKEAPSLQGGFTDIAMEFDGVSTSRDGDAVDFVALPRVSGSQVTERTFAAWIRFSSTANTQSIISPFADGGGMTVFANSGELYLYTNRFNSAPGQWTTNAAAMTTNTWYHVVVTYDHTLTTNDPIMYVDGSVEAINEGLTPAGTLQSELGTHVVIGNAKTATEDYITPFAGKIYDARIYDRILTAAEVTTLYNGGTPDPSLVTDGLVLQAFAVRTDKAASDYIDVELNSDDRIFENVYKAIGFVHGSPIGRVAP
jgi:hypothetical protein